MGDIDKYLKIFENFENIFLVKTVIGNINLNFLTKNDLEDIDEIAYELDIELPLNEVESLEDFYDFEYEKVSKIYNDWYEYINNEYVSLKEELFKLALNGLSNSNKR